MYMVYENYKNISTHTNTRLAVLYHKVLCNIFGPKKGEISRQF
jgi:hypothetical protein